MPRPDKLGTGESEEDAYFISEDLNSFGVADGVGEWVSNFYTFLILYYLTVEIKTSIFYFKGAWSPEEDEDLK